MQNAKLKTKEMIDKDRTPPRLMDYEEFNLRIAYLQLAIRKELLERQLAAVIDLAPIEDLQKRLKEWEDED